MIIRQETAAFPTRASRTEFVARRFAPYLAGSVLDVGCYEAPLRRVLPAGSYTGVDMVGDPDVRLDLERCERLPFPDRSHDTVICIEVLEHLDSLHRLFAELVRCAKGHLVVSLPNGWCDARRPVERGRGAIKHYGLPVQAPPDRHKWFFSAGEAADFLTGMGQVHGLQVVDLFTTEKPRPLPLRLFRRLRHGRTAYLNRYAATVWCVYRIGGP
jgi:SAM-dependent methyltransferase